MVVVVVVVDNNTSTQYMSMVIRLCRNVRLNINNSNNSKILTFINRASCQPFICVATDRRYEW